MAGTRINVNEETLISKFSLMFNIMYQNLALYISSSTNNTSKRDSFFSTQNLVLTQDEYKIIFDHLLIQIYK